MPKFIVTHAYVAAGDMPEIMINLDHVVCVQPIVREIEYLGTNGEKRIGTMNLCRFLLSYALTHAPADDRAGGALEIYAACDFTAYCGMLSRFISSTDAVFYMPPSEVMAAQTAVEASADDVADAPPVGTA